MFIPGAHQKRLDHKKQEFIKSLSSSSLLTEYKVGDTVTYTNEFDVSFTGLKVIGFDDNHPLTEYKPDQVIYLDTSSYWMPVSPDSLEKTNG